jgi:hypothetical protein
MGVATGSATVSTQFLVPPNADLGESELCVIANGIATCVPVHVIGIPKWFDTKRLAMEKALQDRPLKLIFEGFPKVSEGGDPPNLGPETGPEWVRIVQLLAERVDGLQAEVNRLRSFIRSDERPAVGEAPVDRSKAKPGKQD